MSDSNSNKCRIINLPNLGKVHVIPFLNVGTVEDVEKMMPCQPSTEEITNAVFGGRAQVEDENGKLRGVTREEILSLSDLDRAIFAEEFLKFVGGEVVKIEDFNSPVDALAAYTVAELQTIQDSQKIFVDMLNAGFSDKTINLYKESQSLAEQVVAANKFPDLTEAVKLNSSLGTLGSASAKLREGLNSPAIKAALQMQSVWTHPQESYGAAGLLSGKSLGRGNNNCSKTSRGLSAEMADIVRDKAHCGGSKGLIEPFINLPPMKSGEQIMREQINSLKEDLGNRMVTIALHQEKTNSMIISALEDMHNKWKEDEKSSYNALIVAAWSLILTVLLTAAGFIQDYFNNSSNDKYQEDVLSLMKQQGIIGEAQINLLETIEKQYSNSANNGEAGLK